MKINAELQKKQYLKHKAELKAELQKAFYKALVELGESAKSCTWFCPTNKSTANL